jgi:FdhD protein
MTSPHVGPATRGNLLGKSRLPLPPSPTGLITMGRVTERRRVLRIRDSAASHRADTLVAEEPMEIRLNGKPLAITMRTPGDDFALAAGFLVSEGVLGRADELANIVYCAGATVDGSNSYNVVDVRLAQGVPVPDITLERNVYTTSSCGLCGKASLDAVRTQARWPIADDPDAPPVRLEPELLSALPDRLRAAQQVFDRTGGLHAAALFTTDGELLDIREDVGRHNAVDKLVGRALQQGLLPLAGKILLVSGRASFELAQKAVMAGIPVLAAVSAPSSLAVDLAAESNLTLVGFLRGASMNVYAGEQRIALRAEASGRA